MRWLEAAAEGRSKRHIQSLAPHVFGLESAADSGHPASPDDGFAEGGITGLDVGGNGSPRFAGEASGTAECGVVGTCGGREKLGFVGC